MKRILTFFVFLYGYTLSQGQSDTLYRSLAHEGLQREYLLYVPEAYDGTEDWPLVLNFHGYATSAFTQMVFSDMNPVADTAHFLIAYPQGTEFTSSVPGTPERGLGFSIGGPGDTTFSSIFNPDDVDFASKIIDDIANDYKVDLSRVYSTGWSNGGFLSTILANELSDRIAAIAPLGGAIPRSRPFAPTTPVPTLYIHGTADAIAPYGGSDFTRSVEEVLETWATLNGCNVEPTVTRLPDLTEADASTVDLIAWQNCGTPVQHLRVNDGGHQWFGGPNIFPFLGNISLDIHASSEIWNFFSQFSLPSAADYVLPEPKIRPLEKTIEVGGVEREYLLYVPESYDESEETPLVFVYHGADFPVEAQVDVSIMNPVADTAGFIVAYPKSLVVFDATFEVLTSSWTYPGNTGEHDDVEFTREMIDEISSEYNINLSKVYATGWSAGSEFSFHLACVLPDQIAAVAGVGGQMRTPAFDACTASERAVPILQMHGTADVVLPFEGLLDYPSALETI
ncbi:MAG: PHB depolymerase family esterase, partial [Bacteroidota bacterium]